MPNSFYSAGPPGAILVFLPGLRDIHAVQSAVQTDKQAQRIIVIPGMPRLILSDNLPEKDQH